MSSELLQHVRVLDPVSNSDRVADVLIVDGSVETIAPHVTEISPDTQIHPCEGLVLGPGLVDLYSHSGEPGFEARETLNSLLGAAAAGGFTRLAILPDTQPAIDSPGNLAWLQQNSQNVRSRSSLDKLTPFSHLPIPYFWGALTTDTKGQQMTELWELAAAGVVGFADGQPLQNLALIRRLLEYGQPLHKPLALWACNLDLVGNGVARDGVMAAQLGLPGNPTIAETASLASLLEIIAAFDTPVHLMRISTARGVELIQTAKAKGLPITASTTWMHLLLNDEALLSYNSNLRLEPPLGDRQDQMALIQAVQRGTLDGIAIDHTPYAYEEKTVAFTEAPPGVIGLDLALPLLWENLVATGTLSALELWRALSTQPAQCLHQTPPTLAIGQPAEMILFDPQHSWKAEAQMLKSLSSNTPWLGQHITGRVVRTWCPG